MKKSILLITAISAIAYLTFSSYSSGPAQLGRNCTGAMGSTVTHCGGAGCHGGNSATTTVSIRVDSAGGVPVGSYVPGMTYTVTISGTNSSSLPKFGFQFVSVSGIGATQSQAGTYSSLPTRVAAHPLSGLSFLEQSNTITAATAGTYSVIFKWMAPSASGAGPVKMYCTLNAVNGNNSEDAADVSANTVKTLNEATVSHVASSAVVLNAEINAFPNPVGDNLSLQLNDADAGEYSYRMVDITGKVFANDHFTVSGSNHNENINTSTLPTGHYFLIIEGNGGKKVIPLIKNL